MSLTDKEGDRGWASSGGILVKSICFAFVDLSIAMGIRCLVFAGIWW